MRSIDGKKKATADISMVRHHFFSLLFCLMILSSCNQSGEKSTQVNSSDTLVSNYHVADSIPSTFIISDGQAGPFRLGEEMPGRTTMMKWRLRIEQQTRYTEEGPVTEEVVIISDGLEDLVHLKSHSVDTKEVRRINEILIVSPRFVTEEGISLNSTIGEFISAYPDAKAWYTYVSDMTVMETPQLKVQFIVDRKSFRSELPEVHSEMTDLPVTLFNPQNKIQLIRII